jgi:hypothetical protein
MVATAQQRGARAMMTLLAAEPWQPGVNPLGKDNCVPQHDQQATVALFAFARLSGRCLVPDRRRAFNLDIRFVHSGGGFH